ncbi:MAG: DUF4388 domain-containing protein [bacterium]|nr:DUF4388 domain-containing protein [bacterium]
MALEGNIKDFGLTDILQLIAIQQKTGVLTLAAGDETLTISFQEGMVVGADPYRKWKSELLGESLVAAELLSQENLDHALSIQKETGKKLGHILSDEGMVKPEEISGMLNLQVREAIYEVFEWQEGSYRFEQNPVAYDKENMKPIPCDRILMEAMRIMDEWPLVRKVVPSKDLVFRKTDEKMELELADEDLDKAFDMVFDASENANGGGAAPLNKDFPLSLSEEKIYSLVDGKRTAQDLVHLGRIGTFETCKALYSLVSSGLLEAVNGDGMASPVAATKTSRSRGKKVLLNFLGYVIMLLLVGSLLFSAKREGSGLLFSLTAGLTDRFEPLQKVYAVQNMSRILFACRLFYLETHTIPQGLQQMIATGILDRQNLVDPWGNAYRMAAEADRIVVSSAGKDGQLDTSDDLIKEGAL